MSTLQIVLAIVLIVISLLSIVVVLLQKNRQGNLSSAISGGDSSGGFFDKTKGKRKEAQMENITKILIALLLIASLATTCVILFV